MEIISQTVPMITVLAVLFAGVVCFVFPVLTMAYAKSKYNANWMPLIMGGIIFLSFGVVLKALGSGLLLSIPGFNTAIQENLILYAVTGSLLAGVFEETGRFVAFKLMKNKARNIGDAIAYGAGHGGIEAIMMVGIGMLNSFIMATTINLSGADAMINGLEGEDLNAVIEGINSLTQAEAVLLFASGFERFVAMSFHIAASLLIYTAVKKPGYIWMYPVTIILHTILNVPAGLFQVGLMGESTLLTEVVIAVISAMICAFSYVIVNKTRSIKNIQ